MHKALKELQEIIRTPDWSNFFPEKMRQQKLDAWVTKWLVEAEFSQDVVNKDYLTSEYQDLIKYKLSESLAHDLADSCVTFNTAEQKVSAAIVAFRRSNLPGRK